MFRKFFVVSVVVLCACAQQTQVHSTAPLPTNAPPVEVEVGNENDLMLTQLAGAVGVLSASGAGVVADNIYFGKNPQPIQFDPRLFGDRVTDVMLIIYADAERAHPICALTRRINVTRRHTWIVGKSTTRVRNSRYGAIGDGGCIDQIDGVRGEVYNQMREREYRRQATTSSRRNTSHTIAGGLITIEGRVDARISTSRPRPRPRTTSRRTTIEVGVSRR